MQPTRQVLRQLAVRFGLIGESPMMIQAMARLLQVAPTDLSVLVTGETGTGKEVFAHAVHELSQRKKAPFVSVNCGAIPETLLESELFGAEKGAFTGSVEQRKGFFETAHRGTIFLDEIGEMPIATQVKLLRILESGEYSRLGSSDVLKVDVRVVAATNRDLAYEVRQGRFRQDLYFRLNSVNIHLPPLRQHPEDIEYLVEFFAQRAADKNIIPYNGIDALALQLLQQQPWPGNVRELRNIIETMVTLEQGACITEEMVLRYLPQESQDPSPTPMALMSLPVPNQRAQEFDVQVLYRTLLQLSTDVAEVKTILRHLLSMSVPQEPQLPVAPPISPTPVPTADPLEIRPRGSTPAPSSSSDQLDLPTLERQAIETALRRTQGNRRDAAKMLGISERTLYRKIDEYRL
ncbi:MAG: sigma-54-dependent Fis family transcriptional regulator [Candidatus Kapabacteria bacterium]|nr:sigma-54-dependent Fis family transcriptional regulator [Candidatus Kapabacteria bacterium]